MEKDSQFPPLSQHQFRLSECGATRRHQRAFRPHVRAVQANSVLWTVYADESVHRSAVAPYCRVVMLTVKEIILLGGQALGAGVGWACGKG